MSTPDPKTVREIAKAAIGYALRQCRVAAVEAALLAGTTAPVLGREFDDLARAAIAEYDRLAGTLSWPDEQPQMTPQPAKPADIDYCPHTTYPIQVALTLLDGDVDVTHDGCGRIVQTDWPYLRADHVPLELVYATDGDEDWLELQARPGPQPQDGLSTGNATSEDGRAQLTRVPLPDRIDLIAQHLVPATEELRGLHGASHARLLVAAAVASLRWVVADLRAELAQDERDGDVRVVAAVLVAADHAATAPNEFASALGRLEACFGRRVRALEARDAEAGAKGHDGDHSPGWQVMADRAAREAPLAADELVKLWASILHLSGPDSYDEDKLESALIPVTHYVPRALVELDGLRAQLTAPDGICGTTFGVEQAPMFICTLPPGHAPDGMHKNAGGTAWLLDSGAWTIQRGPWWGREPDADSAPQQPESGGTE